MRSPEHIDELVPTRQSLLSRLKDLDDNESRRKFSRTCRKLIHATARRAGLTDAQAQDVVQETIISVCNHLSVYRYDPARGSINNWMLAITRRRIMDRLRDDQSEARIFARLKKRAPPPRCQLLLSFPPSTLHRLFLVFRRRQTNLTVLVISSSPTSAKRSRRRLRGRGAEIFLVATKTGCFRMVKLRRY